MHSSLAVFVAFLTPWVPAGSMGLPLRVRSLPTEVLGRQENVCKSEG